MQNRRFSKPHNVYIYTRQLKTSVKRRINFPDEITCNNVSPYRYRNTVRNFIRYECKLRPA